MDEITQCMLFNFHRGVSFEIKTGAESCDSSKVGTVKKVLSGTDWST